MKATPQSTDPDSIRSAVRERYGRIASAAPAASEGCGCAPTCCAPPAPGAARSRGPADSATPGDAAALAQDLGYSAEETAAAPEGANLGLGCGNPQAIAALRPGETVLDLGSGAGYDAFLAARAVGPRGRVIGVDMTPEMLARARRHREAGGEAHAPVEFRLGEIEHLPVADASVDVILSNCVVNLSPDKAAVFREAFRVLRSGGRLAIADVVALRPIPGPIRGDWELLTGCVAGASTPAEIEGWLAGAGFTDIRVRPRGESRALVGGWFPGRRLEDYVASATIEAVKPAAAPA